MQPYKILVYGDDCIYPQNPALGLGVCAAIFLLAAQVTSAAAGGRRLLRLLQVPLHPFGDQAGRRRRLRRRFVVSGDHR